MFWEVHFALWASFGDFDNSACIRNMSIFMFPPKEMEYDFKRKSAVLLTCNLFCHMCLQWNKNIFYYPWSISKGLCVYVLSRSRAWLRDVARQAPLSTGVSRQEH